MPINTQIITLLYAGGILQSLILIAVIIKKKSLGRPSNQILIALLGAITIVLGQYLLFLSKSSLSSRFISELGTASWFALGPLFYLYALSKSDTGFRFKKQYLLLFVAPLYNPLQYLIGFITPGIAFYFLFDNDVIYSFAWLIAYQLHTLLFIFLAIAKLRKAEDNQHRKLLKFFYLWLVVLSSATVYLMFSMNERVYFYQLEIYMVVIFNVFVLMLSFQSLLSATNFEDPAPPASKELKYSNSSLSKDQLQALHQKLVTAMETEKPYMDRKLNLAQLAQVSGIRENQLSQIFSQYLKSSFYDFISQYRLTEVELRLNDPKYAHLKIISLAEDCGFNSKAAFYKTFKEKHQLTPTQYLKQRKAS